jgi:enoyl-CoA hydratase/carnithine racemase
VRVSREEPGITVVQMCSAEDNNAYSDGMVTALLAAFAAVEHDPEAKVMVLLGLLEVFCSGASLRGEKSGNLAISSFFWTYLLDC